MYTIEQMAEIRRVAADAHLEAPNTFWTVPYEELIKICNGVGADWLSEKSRKIITKAFKAVEATACIHDFEYHFADGKTESQRKADERFLTNGIKECRHYNPSVLSLARLWNERKVIIAYGVLQRIGRLAWRDSFVERKIEKGEL